MENQCPLCRRAILNKKDANRENILKIAREIFSKYGFKKTTLDDIANAVRKGKSSLYYYFKSKVNFLQLFIIHFW